MASKPDMSDATTIDPREAAHFGTMAADWWDPRGSSAMLHKLNPPRLRYVRAAIDAHWGTDPHALRPLAGKRVLDVGCGAGLLAEPLARLGGAVTAIDAAPENIAVASAHAAQQGIAIDYRATGIETLAGAPYDLVTSMEVIEHVTDPALFVAGLRRMLAPGGLMVLSTPNRTALSRLMLITIGEGTGQIPKGTHDWNRFLRPEELEALLNEAGLAVTDTSGLTFDPGKGFTLSENRTLDYLMTVVHAGED